MEYIAHSCDMMPPHHAKFEVNDVLQLVSADNV